ncbi:hypothetical protein ZWY2020_026158 [Hordeum vulgare]|nr:hypothetical protein ZWY2020_026158 [Hordeum vulgare]
MAMPSTASCCFASSSSSPRPTHTAAAWTPARIRLGSRSAPSRSPLRLSFSSAEPAPDVAGDDGEYTDREVDEDRDERYGFEMEVRKLPGKKNRRLVRARVRVGAPLQAVWATLTDYEGLAGFIPGLSECRLLDQDKAFARLYQVGEQDLALGFKFNAKGTLDCYEGEMELLPESGGSRREIAFNMVEGDFKVFEGKWSVHEVDTTTDEGYSKEGSAKRSKPTLFVSEKKQRGSKDCRGRVITRMNPEGFLTMSFLIIVLCTLLNRGNQVNKNQHTSCIKVLWKGPQLC